MKPRTISLATAIAGACAAIGCDVIIGIHDIAPPDGAVLDASFDTLVVPDGPFDGCNGGAEDCANGKDDNCNGLIDCEDPVCQGAGYACTGAIPTGWSGPIAFAAAAGDTIPACSGAYASTGPTGHSGSTASPASCGCACTSSKTTDTVCPSVTVEVFSGNSCNNQIQTLQLTNSICSDVSSSVGSLHAIVGAPTFQGTCTGSPSRTVPPASWANSYAACGYVAPSNTGGCTSGLCVANPGSAYAPKPCVYQNGDVACPGAPYTQKTTFTTTFSDTRDCTACTCGASGGSCSATVVGYTGAGCSSTSQAFAADGGCQFGPISVITSGVTVSQASCSPSGGAPTGAVTTSNPVTVCCQP